MILNILFRSRDIPYLFERKVRVPKTARVLYIKRVASSRRSQRMLAQCPLYTYKQ